MIEQDLDPMVPVRSMHFYEVCKRRKSLKPQNNIL
jgi:hypothetical protein